MVILQFYTHILMKYICQQSSLEVEQFYVSPTHGSWFSEVEVNHCNVLFKGIVGIRILRILVQK